MKRKLLILVAITNFALCSFAQKRNELELRVVSNSEIDNAKSTFGMDFVYRYVARKKFSTGIGFGINSHAKLSSVNIPIFLSEKITFKEEGIKPYINIESGINLHDFINYSSTFINPKFGIEIPLNNGVVLPEIGLKANLDPMGYIFTLSLGYEF